MTLSTLYVRAADAVPDAPALVGTDGAITWREANAAVDSLARTLVRAGIERGDRVALARLKGPESYLAMHAIVRAGAVAVPLDPKAPGAHGRSVLVDAAVRGLITDSTTCRRLEPETIDDLDLIAVVVDGDDMAATIGWSDAIADDTELALPAIGEDDLAYIIYTSGSTGTPKGIVHTHRSAMAYVERAAAAHLLPQDRVAGVSGFHYDMSTLELWAAPHVAAPVVVMSEAHLRFPASFAERLEGQGVTVVYAVTSLLRQLVERGGLDQRDLSAVRSIMFAGEPYPPGALRELFASFPQARFTNVYGPAEVNECSFFEMAGPPVGDEEVPVGAAWTDAESRIRDEDGNDLPDGEAGELWISAPTVMEGYWGRRDLSDPKLDARSDGKPPWYATGDVVVRDADGVLWFRGRTDNQIKLRGMRVELEGVETVVEDAPGVIEAVVGPDAEGSDASNLVAAVVVADGSAFDAATVRRHCAERLPATHVPRRFEVHPAFPLTPSGKLDRTTVRRALRRTPSAPTGEKGQPS